MPFVHPTSVPTPPRILRPVNELPPAKRKIQRISRTERERIAAGEGDAIAMSNDPADWHGLSDRVRFRKLVTTVVKARGADAPAWARDAAEAFQVRRTGTGDAANAARARLLAARKALNDEVQARVMAGVARRETTYQVRDRLVRERRAGNGRVMAQLVADNPLPPAAQRGIPRAVRAYAADLLAKARTAGIRLRDVTEDAHLVHLRAAAEVVRPGSSLDQIHQFVTDDFFLRHDAGDVIRASRQVSGDAFRRSYVFADCDAWP